MNRRTFVKNCLTAPALLPSLSSAVLGSLYAMSSSPAAAAESSGLESEVNEVLRKYFVIDTAASDGFQPHRLHAPLPSFDPEKALEVIGGASLGIGGLSGQVPSFLPESSLLRKSKVITPWIGFRPLLSGPAAVECMLGEFECIHRAVENHAGKSGVALSADGMEALHQEGKLALVIGLDTAHEIDSNLEVLEEFYRLGLRKVALTHEVAPPWAESDTSDAPTGLKPFGRKVVEECNRLGIMVDISHSSDATFWGTIESSKRPIIATHSGAKAIGNMSRNMTEDMIRALAKNGGMIGVGGVLDQKASEKLTKSGFYQNEILVGAWFRDKYPNPEELAAAWYDPANQEEARKAIGLPKEEAIGQTYLTNPESTLAHMDYIIGMIGFDHVGFGTDVEIRNGAYPGMVRGIVAGLIKRNYSEEKLAKILGGNFLRVFRENKGNGPQA